MSALLLCACKGVIAAEEAGVTVENALGYAVNELYIYPNNSDYLQKARKYGHFTGYKN